MSIKYKKAADIESADSGDPRDAGPVPEYPQGTIEYPGSEEAMTPPADHGETSYRGLGRLVGKKALVTGGDSGIGRAVALAFAREGADVAISYLPAEQRDADESAHWIEQAGRRALQVPGDLQDEGYCVDLVSRVSRELGDPDIIINNAAFQSTHEDIADFSTEEIERTFRTNVYATLWICRAALPTMAPGGSIINTASIQAFSPSPNLLAYAATKAAIVNLSKGLAQMAMKRGVRVNTVAPGPVWTPLIPSTMPLKKVQHFGQDTLFGRAAQPVEVAPIFVFLASDESRFVSGEVYGVTGGQMPY
jgi:NAD(P)-dependent dehydrogenase (short-subunit alcohol dehydrogenase family)